MNTNTETVDVLDAHYEKIETSKVTLFKAVFPADTNHHNTMFGGNVMSIMDEVAFLTATRFSRKPIVTVSSNKINFAQPIPSGTIVKLEGKVIRVGKTSVDVQVDLWVESMYQNGLQHAITGTFTLVAINESKKPVPIL